MKLSTSKKASVASSTSEAVIQSTFYTTELLITVIRSRQESFRLALHVSPLGRWIISHGALLRKPIYRLIIYLLLQCYRTLIRKDSILFKSRLTFFGRLLSRLSLLVIHLVQSRERMRADTKMHIFICARRNARSYTRIYELVGTYYVAYF